MPNSKVLLYLMDTDNDTIYLPELRPEWEIQGKSHQRRLTYSINRDEDALLTLPQGQMYLQGPSERICSGECGMQDPQREPQEAAPAPAISGWFCESAQHNFPAGKGDLCHLGFGVGADRTERVQKDKGH